MNRVRDELAVFFIVLAGKLTIWGDVYDILKEAERRQRSSLNYYTT